jgi:hypothetical protein
LELHSAVHVIRKQEIYFATKSAVAVLTPIERSRKLFDSPVSKQYILAQSDPSVERIKVKR